MKQIDTFGGRKFFLEDDKVEALRQALVEGRRGFFSLKSGELVNYSAVVSIGEVETKPYFMGNPMNDSLTKVFVNGGWKQFAGAKDQIEFRPITELAGEDIKQLN